MTKIAVFDSGLGSLSIIQAIQKITKTEIIYFADQAHYPYGTKTNRELRKIIQSSITLLQNKFNPDIIVVGSNTPTLLFPNLFNNKTVIGVSPPLSEAARKTKTQSIAILGTKATIRSKNLDSYINKIIPQNISIRKINATHLIDLVESGKFISQKKYCEHLIRKMLEKTFVDNCVDTVTLSSTHLPFLLPILQKIFPQITFLDSANFVAKQILQNKLFIPSTKNSLTIFTTTNPILFQKHLKKINIKNKVQTFQS